jgi:mono/diheme cytochrome c family protein
MLRLRRSPILVLTALVLGSGPAAAQPSTDKPARARTVLEKHCLSCHGDTAPRGGLKILDERQLQKLVRPRDADHSELIQLVQAGNMPPGRTPKLSDADVQALREWVNDGATPPRPAFNDAYVLTWILKDLEDQGDRKPKPDPVKWRYVSFAHLMNEPQAEERLREHRLALLRAVNLVNQRTNIWPPKAVDPAGTVFRLELDELGWNVQPWKGNYKDDWRDRITLYDLILLEYPYGVVPDESTDLNKAILKDYLARAGMLRPVAYLRGDWLIDAVGKTPLYDDLLRLEGTLAELEKGRKYPAESAVRGGVESSDVLRFPRLIEGRSVGKRSYWRSDNLLSGDRVTLLRRAGIDKSVVEKTTTSSLLLFTLENGLPGFYAADQYGYRVEAAPAGQLKADQTRFGTLRPGAACLRCHAQGPKHFADVLHNAIQMSPALDQRMKTEWTKLYPGQQKLATRIDTDRGAFAAVADEAGLTASDGLRGDELTPVLERYRDYLDDLVREREPTEEEQQVALRSQGTERDRQGRLRDLILEERWERLLRDAGGGAPMVAIDGLTHPNRLRPRGLAVEFEIVNHKTDKAQSGFVPGEKYYVRVVNNSDKPIWIELVVTSQYGAKGQDADMAYRKVDAGKTFTFPDQSAGNGHLKVTEVIGVDYWTLYYSDEPYPDEKGVLVQLYPNDAVRGEHPEVRDRFVHPFYRFDKQGRIVNTSANKLIKRTLELETRAGN